MEGNRYGDEEGETACGKLSKAEAPDVAGEWDGGREAVVVIETEGTERWSPSDNDMISSMEREAWLFRETRGIEHKHAGMTDD